jgi:phosphate-selective porin OprO and OprP
MKMQKLILGVLALFIGYASVGQAQSPVPYFTYGKGLGIIPPDSSFSLNIRFRIQNRAAFETASETDLSVTEVEARVRRLRLRLDGFVYSPKLTYLIQLSFSRGDMDYESLNFPNIIRDAYIQYAFNKSFSIGIGQTKLPGNRQRVNSSGDLQFVDRSMVNSTFNIDRDFGVQFLYKKKFWVAKGAISSGEGRNITLSDYGLAYTGRVELLPFGPFTNGGDYFEGDLAREKSPKISIAASFSHNENAARTGGQLGTMLYSGVDIQTSIVDFLYKHNGWSLAAEFIQRQSPNPITTNGTGGTRYVYTGNGQNYQGGYVFKSNFELVGRYSQTKPDSKVEALEKMKENYTMGLNKYIKGHRVKLQSDITLERVHDVSTIAQSWIYRFQIELGI